MSSFLDRAGGGDQEGSDVETKPPLSSSGGGGGNESSGNCNDLRSCDYRQSGQVFDPTVGKQFDKAYLPKTRFSSFVVVKRRVRIRVSLLLNRSKYSSANSTKDTRCEPTLT